MKVSKRTKREQASDRAVVAVAARPSNTPWWPYLLGFGVTLFAVFQAYGPALSGPFVFDDRYLPFLDPKVAAGSLRAWMSGVRPFLMLSYWLNYQSGGLDPTGYKLVNITLHFLNGVLFWLALRRILEFAGVAEGVRRILAPFGALLFLLHPVQTESVSYAASRSETLSVFFFYSAFVLFLYRRSVAIGWGLTAGVLVLLGCAVLTKEHTAALAAVLLLTDYFWNPGFSVRGIRRNWKLYASALLLGVAGAAFIYLRVLRYSLSAGFGMADLTWHDYFFSQCRAIWVYLRLFVFPFGQNVDYEFPISRGVLDHGAIFGMTALIAVSAAAWMYRKRAPIAAYGWFLFLVLLAPTSSFLPIRDLLVERRLYLPFIGLVLICCEALSRVRVSRTSLAAALAAVLVLFGFLTYRRNLIWASEISLWQDSAEKSPHKSRPRFHLAYAHYLAGQCAESAKQYARAVQVERPDFTLYVDWAVALDCAGAEGEALDKLQSALKLEKTSQVYSLIGMVHAKEGRRPEAFAALEEAERLDPGFEMTYIYRGNLYLLSQEFDRAAEQFRKALAINPANQGAADGLLKAQRRQPVTQ